MMNPIKLRHILHMNPELSFQEFETQKILMNALESMGIKGETIARTGILVLYDVGQKEKGFHLLRADMDALPLKEETGWEYSSKNNYMHACGHDVHMAILFGLIERIFKETPKVNLAFIFQPGEETGGGARLVLEELKDKKIKIINAISLHVTDEYKFGTIASKPGTLFASAYEIDVIFKGDPIHIAFYDEDKDPIMKAFNFLYNVKKLKNENIILVGFGKIEGGKARNILADEVILYGTVRTPSVEISEEILQKMKELVKDGVIMPRSKYPHVSVDVHLFELLKRVSRKLGYTFIQCQMKFTGEDFGFFSQEYPSLMFWLGTRVKDFHGLHNPKFLPPDEIIPVGINLMYGLIKELEKECEIS